MSRIGQASFRGFVLLMVMMLVTATAFTGTAAASHTKCSEVDEFFWVLSVGLLNEHCDADELSKELTDLEQDMANATKVSIHETAEMARQTSDQQLAVTNNYLKDSRTVAMSKAEAAIVEAIDNGKSQSEVRTAAVEAVNDYYTVKQQNLVTAWNTLMDSINTMENTTDQAGLDDEFVYPEYISETDAYASNKYVLGQIASTDWDDSKPIVTDETITLINGTTRISRVLHAVGINSNNDPHATSSIYNVGSGNNGGHTVVLESVHVAPTGSKTGFMIVNISDYVDTWNAIQTQNTQMENNAKTLADSIWNATQVDGMNTSEIISASTLAQEYSTDYNSTGYYSYAVAWAAAGGFAVPNFSQTSLMTIQTASTEYEGLLMSQTAPDNGLFEVGVTYDADNLAGKQFVAETNGNITELTDTFTIISMEDENGSAVQNTTVQQFNYTVVNNSADYAELQGQIRHLRAEILEEDPTTAPGAGGSGGLPFGLSQAEAALGVAGIGVAGYLYMRGQNPTRARTKRRRR